MKKLFIMFVMVSAVGCGGSLPKVNQKPELSPLVARDEAETQTKVILNSIEAYKSGSGKDPQNFKELSIPGKQTVDPWGTNYQFSKQQGRWEVRSAGLDQAFNTEDDIVALGAFE